MKNEKNETPHGLLGLFGSNRCRLGGASTAAAILLGVALCLNALGCEEQSATDEAIEEIRDEADDAEREIKDEIDDHT